MGKNESAWQMPSFFFCKLVLLVFIVDICEILSLSAGWRKAEATRLVT